MQQFLVDIKTMRYDITAAVCRLARFKHDSSNDPTWVIYIWIPSFSLKESGLLKTVEIDVEGGGWESLIKLFHFEASFF